MTTQQGAPLINLGVDITPEVIEKEQVVRVLGRAVRHSRRCALSNPHEDAVKVQRARAAQGVDNQDRRRKASRRPGEEVFPPDPPDACMGFRESRKRFALPTRRSKRHRAA